MSRIGFLLAGAICLAVAGCSKPAPPAPEPASLEDGDACMQSRDWTCAAANYTGYLKAYPADGKTQAKLGISLTRAGKHRESLPAYKAAEAAGIVTYDLFASYAISLEAAGDVDGAIRANRKALEIVPNLVDVRGNLARQLASKGQTQEAIKLLEDFDGYLIRQGQQPYFKAQIATIREQAKGAN
ncbi:MAG: tetratricopeptide repeat protein [Caulobacter sp.]|jgi:tetratricopeptide (TPR) repeat protein